MKLNKYIAKGLAVLFLLMLGQKFGVGLFLHNVLHVTETNKEASSSNDNAISYACNCIDDFSSPFTEAEHIDLATFPSYPVVVFSFIEQNIPAAFYLFSSFRAPPVFIA